MKVYVVSNKWDYEEYSIMSVFKTYESAEKYVCDILKEYKDKKQFVIKKEDSDYILYEYSFNYVNKKNDLLSWRETYYISEFKLED